MIRRVLCLLAVPAALAVCAPAAGAATYTHCRSADLRYPFQPGGPKTFGVFRLRVHGASCRTAHRVARDWMDRFEGALRRGHVKLPRNVDGFAFETLAPNAAQTYNERGRRGAKLIRFDYRVPNG